MTTRRSLAARWAVALTLLAAAAPALATDESAPPDTTGLKDLTPEELLVRASSSALQYAQLIGPATRLLVADHERSLPCLITRLDTDDVRERIAVEDILFRIGADAVDALVDALPREALRTDTTRGARLAAGVLGRIGDARAVDALVAIHEHHDWKLRAAVAGALGGIGDDGASRALVALVRDDNEIVRKSAAVALAQIEAKSPSRSLDRGALDALLAALDDAFYCVRYAAAGALAAAGEPARDDLAGIAASGSGPRALLAIRALGDAGSKRSLGALREFLASADWTVRAEAARAIGAIGPDGGTRRHLEGILKGETHPLVRACAQAAIEAD
jgi:HEAT repeat protein